MVDIPINNFNFTTPSLGGNDTDFNFGDNYSGSIVYIFAGESNAFGSIWCDPEASLTNGRFFVSRPDDLTIIRVIDGEAHTENRFFNGIEGTEEGTLESDDLVDLMVTS